MSLLSPQAFDYSLPEALVAQAPATPRTSARLLVVDRGGAGSFQHAHVRDLAQLLPANALVVLNDTRVVPSRIHLVRGLDDREFELLICEPGGGGAPADVVRAWVRGAKRLNPGDKLGRGSVQLRYLGREPADSRVCRFEVIAGDLNALLETDGDLPLPPYIRRESGNTEEDRVRYQTVFAQDAGSVAAPTAGLHFDDELLAQLETVKLTLHVGPGTFLPMNVPDVREHRVGAERFEISPAAARAIESARAGGRPIVAVGTTVTRTLEHVARQHYGRVVAGSGWTDLVITPGHSWRVVDLLLTNLHLPKSSLLMLTCTFGGRELILAAYREAVRESYRFYSYGDCMLIRQRDSSKIESGHDDDR